jgi:iron only hydrogenase large subunit-like protein
MDFSGVIKLADLNDFLAPAQNCAVNSTQIRTSTQKTAKVTLSDCLACSGCITSAETVLLEQQSLHEFRNKLTLGNVVVSISQQTLSALAHMYNLNIQLTFEKMNRFFRALGVQHVYDMTQARDTVLKATANEFLERYSRQALPVVCSECPGWVCFAEKKAEPAILGFMSRIKTPMQMQKEILKLDGKYHVGITPCFDKKLEAAMEAGVDLVLTTTEILNLLEEEQVQLPSIEPLASRSIFTSTNLKPASHGYAEYILKQAASELLKESTRLEVRNTRRRDMQEILLISNTSNEVVMKFGLASGFQNIQNIVRQLKMGKCEYDYIELMACPTGCLNGGGQPKATRDTIQIQEQNLSSLYIEIQNPEIEGYNMEREFRTVTPNLLKW